MNLDDSSQHIKAEIDFTADFCNLSAKLLSFLMQDKTEKEQVSICISMIF